MGLVKVVIRLFFIANTPRAPSMAIRIAIVPSGTSGTALNDVALICTTSSRFSFVFPLGPWKSTLTPQSPIESGL